MIIVARTNNPARYHYPSYMGCESRNTPVRCGEWAVRSTRNISDSPIREAVRINEFFGAFRALRIPFISLVHLLQKPTRGLFKRFLLHVVALAFHKQELTTGVFRGVGKAFREFGNE